MLLALLQKHFELDIAKPHKCPPSRFSTSKMRALEHYLRQQFSQYAQEHYIDLESFKCRDQTVQNKQILGWLHAYPGNIPDKLFTEIKTDILAHLKKLPPEQFTVIKDSVRQLADTQPKKAQLELLFSIMSTYQASVVSARNWTTEGGWFTVELPNMHAHAQAMMEFSAEKLPTLYSSPKLAFSINRPGADNRLYRITVNGLGIAQLTAKHHFSAVLKMSHLEAPLDPSLEKALIRLLINFEEGTQIPNLNYSTYFRELTQLINAQGFNLSGTRSCELSFDFTSHTEVIVRIHYQSYLLLSTEEETPDSGPTSPFLIAYNTYIHEAVPWIEYDTVFHFVKNPETGLIESRKPQLRVRDHSCLQRFQKAISDGLSTMAPLPDLNPSPVTYLSSANAHIVCKPNGFGREVDALYFIGSEIYETIKRLSAEQLAKILTQVNVLHFDGVVLISDLFLRLEQAIKYCQSHSMRHPQRIVFTAITGSFPLRIIQYIQWAEIVFEDMSALSIRLLTRGDQQQSIRYLHDLITRLNRNNSNITTLRVRNPKLAEAQQLKVVQRTPVSAILVKYSFPDSENAPVAKIISAALGAAGCRLVLDELAEATFSIAIVQSLGAYCHIDVSKTITPVAGAAAARHLKPGHKIFIEKGINKETACQMMDALPVGAEICFYPNVEVATATACMDRLSSEPRRKYFVTLHADMSSNTIMPIAQHMSQPLVLVLRAQIPRYRVKNAAKTLDNGLLMLAYNAPIEHYKEAVRYLPKKSTLLFHSQTLLSAIADLLPTLGKVERRSKRRISFSHDSGADLIIAICQHLNTNTLLCIPSELSKENANLLIAHLKRPGLHLFFPHDIPLDIAKIIIAGLPAHTIISFDEKMLPDSVHTLISLLPEQCAFSPIELPEPTIPAITDALKPGQLLVLDDTRCTADKCILLIERLTRDATIRVEANHIDIVFNKLSATSCIVFGRDITLVSAQQLTRNLKPGCRLQYNPFIDAKINVQAAVSLPQGCIFRIDANIPLEHEQLSIEGTMTNLKACVRSLKPGRIINFAINIPTKIIKQLVTHLASGTIIKFDPERPAQDIVDITKQLPPGCQVGQLPESIEPCVVDEVCVALGRHFLVQKAVPKAAAPGNLVRLSSSPHRLGAALPPPPSTTQVKLDHVV